jgi:hypothetical protein
MANPEHLEILKRGIKAWNNWRDKYPHVKPNLSKAKLNRRRLVNLRVKGELIEFYDWVDFSNVDLQGSDMSESNLSLVNLAGANLTGANLMSANLWHTNLKRVNFSGATLLGANLEQAFLDNANLREAHLAGADLTQADLAGADFSFAFLHRTKFGDNDLSVAKGLDLVKHIGPSTIGIDTLYKSAGRIPEAFLRGCGIPDDFITFIASHFGIQQAIQFYSCFISYSTRDEEFARRLYSRMRDEKLRVWFAAEDAQGGKKLYEQIERAIQLHDRLLIVLSERSLQSRWVMTEIRRARKVELRENRRKLFPIRLVDYETLQAWECFDADTGEDLATEVRGYFIPDFSNWKDLDAFEKAFERLLHDLSAE